MDSQKAADLWSYAAGYAPLSSQSTWTQWKQQVMEELIVYFLWYDTDRIENDAFNSSLLPPERIY
jgi:hypothetical protein